LARAPNLVIGFPFAPAAAGGYSRCTALEPWFEPAMLTEERWLSDLRLCVRSGSPPPPHWTSACAERRIGSSLPELRRLLLQPLQFSFASSDLCKTFGVSNTDYGIDPLESLVLRIVQFLNGLLADRSAVRQRWPRATHACSTTVRPGFYHQKLGPMFAMLWWYILLRSFDGYIQAFGAPGMVKINAAWFARAERGRFAGIFGLMINLGRFINNSISPLLLAGFTIFSYTLPRGSWQYILRARRLRHPCQHSCCSPPRARRTRRLPRRRAPRVHDGCRRSPLPWPSSSRPILSNRLVWITHGPISYRRGSLRRRRLGFPSTSGNAATSN
jgi:hypothetical protein